MLHELSSVHDYPSGPRAFIVVFLVPVHGDVKLGTIVALEVAEITGLYCKQ